MALADYINSKPTKRFHLGIAQKDSNKVIGDIWVYLIKNDRMASIAIRLSKKWHGRGYGTESLSAMTRFCFEKTELQRIWTEVDVRNVASCRILTKAGYTREVVQKLMGHSSISITMNSYTHVLENKMNEEIQKFGFSNTEQTNPYADLNNPKRTITAMSHC